MTAYLLFIFTLGGIYALLAQSLNLIWGSAGMVNLGLAGFFAVGAYASAMATKYGGVPVPLGLALAVAAAAVTGVVVTLSTLKLRDDYLAIITLGFAETVRLVALNETWLTNGSDGISAITRPFFAVLGSWFPLAYAMLVTMLAAFVWQVMRRLDRAPFGRALKAIREDPELAAFAGKDVVAFKLKAFAVSAGIAGLAGGLYGHFTSYIAPDIFQPLMTVYIFLAVTAGGVGRPSGALLGAYLVIAFLESTRFLADAVPGLSALQVASVREMLVGLALLLVLRLRPQGLLPEQGRPVPRTPGAAA
jgi:branched-chain amino acid transport system permease protein